MKICLTLTLLLLTLSSHAQEDYASEGQITTPAPSPSSEAPTFIRVHAIFDSFQNQSFRKSGIQYGAEVGFESLGEYYVFAGAPMYYGQVQTKNVSEFGNPYIGGEVLFFESGALHNWVSLSNSFGRPDAEIAARNSTLKPGLELRYDKIKTVGSLGADYFWRYGEQDTKVDVKDIISAHASVGRKLSRRFTLEAEVLWYRAFGVKMDGLIIAPQSDWAGAGPVGKFHLGSGVLLRTSLLFPVHRNRSQAETEVAVWDASLPKTNEVTWQTDVGVQF